MTSPTTDFQPTPPPDRSYWRLSRTPLYSFLIALPLFILYEVLILVVNLDAGGAYLGLGVEIFFKQMMLSLGTGPLIGLSVAVFLIGLFIFFQSRKEKVPVIGNYFGWMIVESAVYAVLMAVVVGTIIGTIFGVWTVETIQQGSFQQLSFFEMLTLSIGAGLYEEFFFRLLLVGGLFWLFKQFYSAQNRQSSYYLAAIIGALIFSAVHYIGNMGDAFTLASFSFRFLLGLVLNVIFLWRGFGIAAWSHSLYDILVTMMV